MANVIRVYVSIFNGTLRQSQAPSLSVLGLEPGTPQSALAKFMLAPEWSSSRKSPGLYASNYLWYLVYIDNRCFLPSNALPFRLRRDWPLPSAFDQSITPSGTISQAMTFHVDLGILWTNTAVHLAKFCFSVLLLCTSTGKKMSPFPQILAIMYDVTWIHISKYILKFSPNPCLLPSVRPNKSPRPLQRLPLDISC